MVFVYASKCLGLNKLPSVQKRMYAPPSSLRSSEACWSIMVKNIVNSGIAVTQPCFMPFAIGKACERSLLCLTRPNWLSWSLMTMVRNFGGRPSFSRIFQSPFLHTVSNAFVRSTDVICNPLFCLRHFCWICIRTNTMSVVRRLALKPHWISGRCCSAMVGTGLFSNTLGRILLVMERKVIPR